MYSKRSTETHLKECEELTGTKLLFRVPALQLPLSTTRGFKAAKLSNTLDEKTDRQTVTGLLFLINSTYALLCEQQIEVSSRRPLNRKERKCVTDE